MVIGFKNQFVQPIMANTKIHTIRADAYGRWRAGIMMHMATGTRTKYYNCFKQTLCISTQRIVMTLKTRSLNIKVDGHSLCEEQKETLALNDGFASLVEFERWWLPELTKQNGIFAGVIIHWTVNKYQ